jgi:diadenosine tetraphosphate (Ap4A) HIT family hydrolase
MVEADVCPFCARIAAGDIIVAGTAAAVIPDAFPEHPGHVLVVPHACRPDLFALPPAVLAEIWSLTGIAQGRIRGAYPADGVQVRVNVGAAAGQTVEHAHVHVLGRPTTVGPRE